MAQSQLEPAWGDNVFPQPKESMGEEEEMTVHSYSWGVTDKAGPPSQHTTKKMNKLGNKIMDSDNV